MNYCHSSLKQHVLFSLNDIFKNITKYFPSYEANKYIFKSNFKLATLYIRKWNKNTLKHATHLNLELIRFGKIAKNN
jgi:hypothetical protein